MRDKLLRLLAGTTAQEWADRRDLLAKTGATEQELDAALEALHAERAINRSKIIRGDLEIHAIWITGVIAKVAPGFTGYVINPHKVPPSGSFTRPDKAVIKEKTMPPEIKNEMSKAEKMIRYISANGSAKTEALAKLIDLPAGKVGGLLSYYYITKKMLEVTKYERAVGPAGNEYHLAKGVTFADFTFKANELRARPATDSHAVKNAVAEVNPIQQDSSLTSNAVHIGNSDKSHAATVIPAFLLKTAHPAAPATVPPKFRCALLSDGTAMMDIPEHGRIELNREDARELFNYMVGVADYATNDLNL